MVRDRFRNERQAVWLERLARGRPVFVYAWDMGKGTPLIQGVEAAAPFFCPWNDCSSYSCFRGSIAIGTTLTALVAKGYANAVAAQFRGEKKRLLTGLPPPHNALASVGPANTSVVRDVLERRLLGAPCHPLSWLAAASYWGKVLRDGANMRQCLNAVMSAFADLSWGGALASSHADTLLPLFRQLPKKAVLRWIVGRMSRVLRHAHDQGGMPKAFLAQVWMEILGDANWARWLLETAATDRFHPLSRHSQAMYYIALFSDDKQADHAAVQTERLEHSNRYAAAMFWQCFRDRPKEARKYLENPVVGNCNGDALDEANAWMLHFDDKKRAKALLETVNVRRSEHRQNMALWKAKLHFSLFDDRRPMNRLLARTLAARNCHAARGCAYWLMHDLGDADACHVFLTRAEHLCRTVADFRYCARNWLWILGLRGEAERCLKKAEAAIGTKEDVVLCAEARMNLLDDTHRARGLLN